MTTRLRLLAIVPFWTVAGLICMRISAYGSASPISSETLISQNSEALADTAREPASPTGSETIDHPRATVEFDKAGERDGDGTTEADAKTFWTVAAIFVSLVSLGTSIYFSWCARDHNRRSVKPLPFILTSDYEDRIRVSIQNNGTGPLILQKAQAKLPDGRSGHLIDLIPEPPTDFRFSNFNRVQQFRAIRPGEQTDLLDAPIDLKNAAHMAYRDWLRKSLGEMTVELTYTDIYETRFPIYSWPLRWFHRSM